MDEADPGDDPGAGSRVVVHTVRGQGRDLEEGAPLVEQAVDPIARQQLPPGDMPGPRRLRSAQGRGRHRLFEHRHERPLRRLLLAESG